MNDRHLNPHLNAHLNRRRMLQTSGLALGVSISVPAVQSLSAWALAQERNTATRLPRENLLLYRDQAGMVHPVDTIDQWTLRRDEIVRGMQSVMGKLPGDEKRCPLDIQIEEEVDHGTHLQRLISYQSEPGKKYRPICRFPKRHSLENQLLLCCVCMARTMSSGMALLLRLGTTPNRSYALELAQRGYVTLAPNYPLLAKYQPNLASLGWESGTLKAVWDNIRGLDLLESLPYVDAKRGFGTIGHSLGGHNSVYTSVSSHA